jgi:hypothetical protein
MKGEVAPNFSIPLVNKTHNQKEVLFNGFKVYLVDEYFIVF